MASMTSSRRPSKSVLPRVRPPTRQPSVPHLAREALLEEVMAQPTLSAEQEAILIGSQALQPLEEELALRMVT